LPALNSFFRRYERQEAQIMAIKAWIYRQKLNAPVILVTHQVNITGLTDVFSGSGELVIVRRSEDGGLAALGTIETECAPIDI
jgi:hypothetical protein